MRILVVDDNVDAADSLAFILRLRGHEVVTAYNGGFALKTAAEFLPGAVVCDIGLPVVDGWRVADQLRRSPETSRTVLIALTAYGTQADARRSEEAGFNIHLTKPVDLRMLLGTIEGRTAG